MADWYRNRRGRKGWFEGKDLLDLLDRDSGITNPMLVSRATYEPSTGVFEVFVNMYEPIPFDPVRSRRSIGNALKGYFGVQGLTITDVQPGQCKGGKFRTRVAFYAKTAERPDAGKVSKVREVIAKAAVEPLFIGVNKSGDTVEYAYTELPYNANGRSRIYKGCYERRAGADRKNYAVQGYYWNVV